MEMSNGDRFLVLWNIILSTINVFTTINVVKKLYRYRNKFHFSYRLIRYQHVTCLLLVPLCIVPVSIVPLMTSESDADNQSLTAFFVYRAFAIAITTISVLMRTTSMGMFVERCVATAYAHSYETGPKFHMVGPLVCCVAVGVSVLMGAAYQTGLYPFLVHVGAVLVIDVTNILFTWLLLRENKKQRRITHQSTIRLTQRYQVNENICVLYMILPLAIAESLLNGASSMSGPIAYWISERTFYRDHAYYTMSNVTAFVLLLITLRTHNFRPVTTSSNNRKDVTCTIGREEVKVVNVFGEPIQGMQSQHDHFDLLKKQWV